MPGDPRPWLRIHPEVARALADHLPVVVLESTVLTHGLPRPANLELARQMESEVRAGGAIPATIAMIEGDVHLGLDPERLERLALDEQAVKINRRDLGVARARRLTGGTTVSATMYVAAAAGARVFATGGIGGVHRGEAGDVSADLPELARTSVAVVCAGAKAILDLPKTLEWLETAGVPVIGYQTDNFPAFFTRQSDLPLGVRADSPAEAAALLHAHWDLDLGSGVVIAAPCPEDSAVPALTVELALENALEVAAARGIAGKALTPFLLAHLADATDGATLRANLALLKNNARLAGEIAVAFGV